MAGGLYKHQRDAVEKMHNGCILCGGVGTGKSRTALAYFFTKVCHGDSPFNRKKGVPAIRDPRPLYIITTARKRDTKEWEAECAPFLISHGEDSLVPLTVDSWNRIEHYIGVSGAFFIFDEQRVVGNGKWVKSFLKIAKRNQWVLLSATPGDTWLDYCPVFLANGFYKNRTAFIREHVVYNPYSKFPQVSRYIHTRKLEHHRKQVVVDMPFDKRAVKHKEAIKVGYNKELYAFALKNRWNVYKDEPAQNISELCYILRKVVNDDDRRLNAVNHLLQHHPRMIIFYNFDYELEKLRSLGDKISIDYSEWNGHRHEPVPKSKRWLYFVQYAAGSEGWNCTDTDTMVFYSQSYSYKSTEQASGRIDRLNTPFSDLYYYRIFSDAPIDNAIGKCLVKKKDFNERTFIQANTD